MIGRYRWLALTALKKLISSFRKNIAKALAREAIEKGLISTGRFAEYMGLTRTQAMKVIASEIWTRPEQEADAQVEVIDT